MSKTKRYERFMSIPWCFSYHYGEKPLDIIKTPYSPLIVELWCGSGAYTLSLARRYPDYCIIWVDKKSDRLCFWADIWIKEGLNTISWLRTQVDHLGYCLPPTSVDECRITFPDPRPTRDRQKLTSPKYQTILYPLLKSNGLVHLKTDDKDFFEYSLSTMDPAFFECTVCIFDIYDRQNRSTANPSLQDLLSIRTYYEQQRLDQWRKVYYACRRKR